MAQGSDQILKWSFGLVASGKYLSAEKFQSKVTLNGIALKSKETWTMERVCDKTIALKSCYGKYLTAFKKGNLDGSGEAIGEDQTFSFEIQPDGKVAIRNVTHDRYIGGSGDNLSCFDKSVGPSNTFTIHLCMHPQVNLKNVNRKTYAHLSDDKSSVNCDEEIPWGYDAMIMMEFHDGKYALRAANTQYLVCDGSLTDDLDDRALYVLEFHGAHVAFRDNKGKYLTAVGTTGKMLSRKATVGKDELFLIEDSHPQVSLVANNGKYVANRDGVEIRANQAAKTDTEIFQMEAIDRTDRSGDVKWAFRSKSTNYWNASGSLASNMPNATDSATHITVEWMGPFVALKASNGKYISATSNGQMAAKSAELTDTCKFVFEFINRPILVLRGEVGFVGAKGVAKVLECNRSQYDVYRVTSKAGTYNIGAVTGKFWKVEIDNSLSTNGEQPTDFFIELRAHTRMAIIAPNGKYLKGKQNGAFQAIGDKIESSTLWEY